MNLQKTITNRIDLSSVPLVDLMGKFASGGHKPGSGSASAMQGLISCALMKTVISLTLGRQNYQRKRDVLSKIKAVSYTHLTLPTIYSV